MQTEGGKNFVDNGSLGPCVGVIYSVLVFGDVKTLFCVLGNARQAHPADFLRKRVFRVNRNYNASKRLFNGNFGQNE